MHTIIFDLQMFANVINTTDSNVEGNDLSPTMKTFYKTQMLENVRVQNYFTQLGKKQALPRNNGKKIEWRKFDTFEKALTPLQEGITPDGHGINITSIETEILQYGDYVTVTDRLEVEAVDPIISNVTEETGAQAGETLDTLARNTIIAGKHVMFAGGKDKRNLLTANDKITTTDVNKAATYLKKMKAPKIDGKYLALIHPSVAEDLRESDGWLDVHKYSATTEIFNGEIGELHGVRFIETTTAKVWKEGAEGVAVYATLFMGKDSYGVIEPDAESLEIIVKQKGSAGSADPLNQRSTIGWKASTGSIILYEERLLRFESGSSYSALDEAN